MVKVTPHFGVFFLIVVCFTSSVLCDTNCPSLPRRPIEIVISCVFPTSSTPSECRDNYPSGTIVKYGCAKYFVASGGEVRRREVACVNGKWRRLNAFAEFSCNYGCGEPSQQSQRQPLIVYGKPINRDRWPWHATIFRHNEDSDNFEYICGGTLISSPFLGKPTTIITGAHCLTEANGDLFPSSRFKVVLGAKSSRLEANIKDAFAKVFTVKQVLLAPSFDIRTHDSDVGLLHLTEDISLSDYILPACFPYANSREFQDIIQLILSAGNTGEIVGFGLNEFGNVSESLKYAELPILSPKQCYDELDTIPNYNQFCAGYIDPGSKSPRVCQGDSGGGFILRNIYSPNKRYYILGLVSFGKVDPKRVCQNVAVFSRIHKFADWVAMVVEMFETDSFGLDTSDEGHQAQISEGNVPQITTASSVTERIRTTTPFSTSTSRPTTTSTITTTTLPTSSTTRTTTTTPPTSSTTRTTTTTLPPSSTKRSTTTTLPTSSTTRTTTTTLPTSPTTRTTTTTLPTSSSTLAPKSTTISTTPLPTTTTTVRTTRRTTTTTSEPVSSEQTFGSSEQDLTGEGCPPLDPGIRTVITCNAYTRFFSFGTRPVNCLNPKKRVPFKTIATVKCKRFYRVADDSRHDSAQMVCQSNGQWSSLSPKDFKCIVDCGEESQHIGDVIAGRYSCPAAVGLFHENPLGSGHYELFCHATMIGESGRALVTAAHCVTRNWMNKERLDQDKNFVAVVGKFHRLHDFNNFDKIQRRHVVDFDTHPGYKNISTSTSDIAILWLDTPIIMEIKVRPMCLPQDDKTLGEYGSMIWGKPLNGEKSKRTLDVTTRTLAIKVCKPSRAKAPVYSKYIQRHKATCNVAQQGISTCDVGGGGCVITRSHRHHRWVIDGIVSPAQVGSGGEECFSGGHSVFTRIAFFRDWIDAILEAKDSETDNYIR